MFKYQMILNNYILLNSYNVWLFKCMLIIPLKLHTGLCLVSVHGGNEKLFS